MDTSIWKLAHGGWDHGLGCRAYKGPGFRAKGAQMFFCFRPSAGAAAAAAAAAQFWGLLQAIKKRSVALANVLSRPTEMGIDNNLSLSSLKAPQPPSPRFHGTIRYGPRFEGLGSV